MSLEEKIRLVPRELKSDERGWFLKVITGHEDNLPAQTGEVYLTLAYPGQVRGNHYHLRTNEWFTVVQGNAQVIILDPRTGNRQEWFLQAANPTSLYVPAGIAHAFINPKHSLEDLLLVAYADQQYDPEDTIPFVLL